VSTSTCRIYIRTEATVEPCGPASMMPVPRMMMGPGFKLLPSRVGARPVRGGPGTMIRVQLERPSDILARRHHWHDIDSDTVTVKAPATQAANSTKAQVCH
jgi:hypothetical protein